MSSRQFIVAVPARISSERLPGKVLEDIGGRPMLRRVLEQCKKAVGIDRVVLCTDSDHLSELAASWGYSSLMTSENCDSGSSRIASVVNQLVEMASSECKPLSSEKLLSSFEDTLIINVQGDQPFLDPEIITEIIDMFAGHQPAPAVITPVYKLDADRIHDSSIVKVLRAFDNKALYFSRSALPHVRDLPPSQWHLKADYWGHIGIYGYRADVLLNWNNMPNSVLERLERLEQLRLIDSRHEIITFEVNGNPISIDTYDQLEAVRAMIHRSGMRSESDSNKPISE